MNIKGDNYYKDMITKKYLTMVQKDSKQFERMTGSVAQFLHNRRN